MPDTNVKISLYYVGIALFLLLPSLSMLQTQFPLLLLKHSLYCFPIEANDLHLWCLPRTNIAWLFHDCRPPPFESNEGLPLCRHTPLFASKWKYISKPLIWNTLRIICSVQLVAICCFKMKVHFKNTYGIPCVLSALFNWST